MDISRLLPNAEYQAAVNSNSPSAINPFATIADVPQGLSETLAIDNTILDSQQIESVDGKAILQVNNLGVGAFKGTIGVDVVSTLDISDGQAQFFLFSPTFSRVGGFGLFANDVLRNFNAGAGDSYPTRISAKGGILNANVKNSVQIGGNSTIVKTDETAYVNQIGFNTGLAGEMILTHTPNASDFTATLQAKTGTVALLSDIPAGGGGLYGGSGSLQSGFTTVTMGFFDTLQFLKSGGAGTIVSVSDGTDEAFFGGKIVGVSDNTNSKKLQLDSTINGISFIDSNVGGGTQNFVFQEPTSLVTHTITLPQDVSGTVALTTDITVDAVAQTYTVTNVSTDRTYDADSSSVDELADVVGTLIADLKTSGIIL